MGSHNPEDVSDARTHRDLHLLDAFAKVSTTPLIESWRSHSSMFVASTESGFTAQRSTADATTHVHVLRSRLRHSGVERMSLGTDYKQAFQHIHKYVVRLLSKLRAFTRHYVNHRYSRVIKR